MKKLLIFILSVAFILSLSVMCFASGISLIGSGDVESVKPGDSIKYTLSLTGGTDAQIEGFAFHVQYTDGLSIESSSVLCSDKFMMCGFSAENGLFSAVIAKDSSGVSDETWDVLEVVFSVKETASGTQSISVTTPSNDEKWQLFNISYKELSCEVTGTQLTVSAPGDNNEEKTESSIPAESPNENASSFVDNTGSSESNEGINAGTSQEKTPNSQNSGSSSNDNNKSDATSGQTNSAANTDTSSGALASNSTEPTTTTPESSDGNVNTEETGQQAVTTDTTSDTREDGNPIDNNSENSTELQEGTQHKSQLRLFALFGVLAAVVICVIAAIVVIRKKSKH